MQRYVTLVGPVSNLNERCSFLSVALKYNTIVKCKNERGLFAREGPARVSFLKAEASLNISKFPKSGKISFLICALVSRVSY